ncbi:hypothetical protein BDQ12DRAFT_670891 [Crucibulum laeve]|uniref:Uncharacterized protein n=1 Tax=Crucibulum laeve TaxID=68775 RepID=A0A5C3LIN7_9AGAR|nr:hypothetical protein BDQ12DRAFT_670891 [Crucibulum laeve]
MDRSIVVKPLGSGVTAVRHDVWMPEGKGKSMGKGWMSWSPFEENFKPILSSICSYYSPYFLYMIRSVGSGMYADTVETAAVLDWNRIAGEFGSYMDVHKLRMLDIPREGERQNKAGQTSPLPAVYESGRNTSEHGGGSVRTVREGKDGAEAPAKAGIRQMIRLV